MATDQPDFSTGTMLALYPDPALADQLAIDGGLPSSELHVTVAYTGHADDVDQRRLFAAGEIAARRQPFTATLSGHARFAGGDKDVIVALVDSPELEQLRRDTLDALTEQGVVVPADHGFIAHMTLAYLGPEDDDPVGRLPATPVDFTHLAVVHGQDRTDLPLADGLAGLAREAFAMGWAASGGPMTDRVRAGCTAAVDLALANPGEPGVLEATLHLGHLEGVWAAIYGRREQVHQANEERLRAAWAKLDLQRYAARIVRAYRRRAGLTEATADPDWLTALVQGLVDDGLTDAEAAQAKAAIQQSLRDAAAEGQTGQVALSADQLGMVGTDFNIAFQHAYDALADADNLIGEDPASQWLATLLGDQANEVGTTLARLAKDGASAAEMETAVSGVLSGKGSRALLLGTDLLTSRAMSQGALDLYQSEGLEQVDYVTAGDNRVCPQCEEAEENSPYLLADAPVPGLHPLCRCTLAPTVPLPGQSIDRFINGAEDEELDAADAAAAATPTPAVKAGQPELNVVKAAQQRQADIDVAKGMANAVADLHMFVDNAAGIFDDGWKSAVNTHIDRWADRGVVTADEADAMRSAVQAGDPRALNTVANQVADRANLTQVGKPGDVVTMDRKVHAATGEDLRNGDTARVFRPGYQYSRGDETLTIVKAEVESTDAMPVPEAAKPYHQHLDGIEDIARSVESGYDLSASTVLSGGTSDVRLVTTNDGRQLIRKSARTLKKDVARQQADADQAASILGQAFGMPVARVYRDAEDAFWMEYFDTPSVAEMYVDSAGDPDEVEELRDLIAQAVSSDEGQIAGVFDMSIRNGDRHIGNWTLRGTDGQFGLYDHGQAFGTAPVGPPRIIDTALGESTLFGPFALNYVQPEDWTDTVWAENNLTAADIAELRARAESARPAFEHIGRGDWLDKATETLNTIEPYATGSRNLIAEG